MSPSRGLRNVARSGNGGFDGVAVKGIGRWGNNELVDSKFRAERIPF